MKIFVAGDFCPIYRAAEAFEKRDYVSVLGEVKSTIEQADYSIVNFECPVCYGNELPIEKCGPNLKCSEKGLEAVKWAGFNCVTLANNHLLDYGEGGVESTLTACKRLEIDSVGGGKNLAEAEKILFKNINGKKLAIVNCCEHEFSIATYCSAGSNPINPVRQFYAIKEAKANADYVLVIVHGGHEHFQLPSARMVEIYRFFVDCGADAVVNHHQHCFSGYEVYNGKPIFYGLGNFCFDNLQKRNGKWTEGYAVTIDFSKDSIDYTIHPYTQCNETPSIKMLSEDVFSKRVAELNSIITDAHALNKALNDYYRISSKQYEDAFEPIQNRLYLGAKKRGWIKSLIGKDKKLLLENYIFCESHRDKIFWWLSSRKKMEYQIL